MTLFECNSAGRQAQSGPDHRRGFTLVELLVVIAIIALLMSILIPSLSRAREVARRTVCATHLKGIGVAYFEYNSDNGALPPISWGLYPQYSYAFWSFFMVQGGYLPGTLGVKTGGTQANGPYTENGAAGPIFYCPDKTTVYHGGMVGPGNTSDYSPPYALFHCTTTATTVTPVVSLTRIQHPALCYLMGENLDYVDGGYLVPYAILDGLGPTYTATGVSGTYDANAHLNTTNMLFTDGHAETLDGLVPHLAWSDVPPDYGGYNAYPPWGDN